MCFQSRAKTKPNKANLKTEVRRQTKEDSSHSTVLGPALSALSPLSPCGAVEPVSDAEQ